VLDFICQESFELRRGRYISDWSQKECKFTKSMPSYLAFSRPVSVSKHSKKQQNRKLMTSSRDISFPDVYV